ncbi:hypothetical protein BEL05_00265 [Shewanella colwelliana]|uniref:VOC family protein n=1 Tax=Shewanella colwelliana TaxID=23 RepID=A0A1E5IT07_SHECO|nr:VOC family protein [Shewanella colwelliana]OEG73701.1 hypothetical protein BEL05_00265 [Shewanella colwelliana]
MNQNTITAQTLIDTWPTFEATIVSFLADLQLDRLNMVCDHVALRVNSDTAADSLRDHFCHQGAIISNNMINGRPILIIELNTPLMLGPMCIDCVELPYPGEKQYPNEGWEHIELVLPGNACNGQQLSAQLIEAVPTLAPVIAGDSEIDVKLSSPQGEHERLANPTIAFKHQGLCIKVHAHGIKAIIASEKR